MLISSGASPKVPSQIPLPQTIVDLLEQEWWARAAAPEGPICADEVDGVMIKKKAWNLDPDS